MGRILDCFNKAKAEKRAVFTGYLTMGAPSLEQSENAVATLIENGVDIIEFGIPFSDPMADGATIRSACDIALKQGIKFNQIIEKISDLRQRFPQTVFVLFSYYNVIYSKGLNNFAKMAADAGIDAVLVVDVVLEDRNELISALAPYNISLVPLIAPSTPIARVAQITKDINESFLYVITVNGVTGERLALPDTLQERLQSIKNVTSLPIVAGFGVSNKSHAKMISEVADGFVIGSAIVKILLENDDSVALKKLATFAATFA